jgi:hypothetical protein
MTDIREQIRERSLSLQQVLSVGHSASLVAGELFQRLRLASEWKERRIQEGDSVGAEQIQRYIWEIVNAFDRLQQTALSKGDMGSYVDPGRLHA